MNIKNTICTTLFLASLVSTHAYAARSENQQALVEGTTFTTSVIAGAVAGGPVGMIVGALGGSYLANQTRKANDNEIAVTELTQTKEALIMTAEHHEEKIETLESELAQTMTFQVLFATGKDTLSELDEKRVIQLATFLKNRPHLQVNLDGHADPRGTDEYNNVLSIERALTLQKALVDLGVEPSRIQAQGYGASQTKATKGDLTEYSLERRVDIEIQAKQSVVDSHETLIEEKTEAKSLSDQENKDYSEALGTL